MTRGAGYIAYIGRFCSARAETSGVAVCVRPTQLNTIARVAWELKRCERVGSSVKTWS